MVNSHWKVHVPVFSLKVSGDSGTGEGGGEGVEGCGEGRLAVTDGGGDGDTEIFVSWSISLCFSGRAKNVPAKE